MVLILPFSMREKVAGLSAEALAKEEGRMRGRGDCLKPERKIDVSLWCCVCS